MNIYDLPKQFDLEKIKIFNPGYETLFLESPEATFALDLNGRFIFANPKFKEFLGYDMKDLNKLQKNIIYHDSATASHHFNLAAKGISSTFEAVLINKKGNHLPVKVYFIPSIDANKTYFILGICKNMPESLHFENDHDRVFNSSNQFQRLAKMGTWEYDLLKNECFWSKQMYNIFGVDHTHLTPIWNSAYHFVHPDDKKYYESKLTNALKKGESSIIKYRIIKNSGQTRLLLERIDMIKNKRGRVIRLMGSVKDITDVRKLETRLMKSKDQFRSITDHLHAVIWSFNYRVKEVTYCSSGIEKLFGITASAFKENPHVLMDSVHPEDLLTLKKTTEKIFNGEQLNSQFRIIDRNGVTKRILSVTMPIFDNEGKLWRIDGIIQDITEDKNYTEVLSELVYYDYLTKLPNRHYFEQFLKEKIKSAKLEDRQFAIFYLDLDLFDYVNDTFGYDVGDRLLAAIAHRLRKNLNETAFLARIAGDEFTICIEGITEIAEAFPVAQKIIKEMEAPFYIDGSELFVTVSIGISFFPFDGEDSHTLLKNANNALKKVKDIGRNDWQIYSPSMDIKSFKSFQLESDLHKAMANREFYLEYQPKVDTITGKIKGAEALIRWKHPDWGTVSPGEFIMMAEENGLIFELGDWVLEEVCKLLSRWKEEGIEAVPISVNISPKRLLKDDFTKTVKKLITSAGIAPSLIELELTEYVIVKNIEKIKQIILDLKGFGVRFALDDFGTGYSSLSYLKDIAFDTLKIDKSFIDGICLNQSNEGIIKAAIFLSKELRLDVVAEGVERKEQFNFLLEQECHQIQGYLLSKPVKEPEFKGLLKRGMIQVKGVVGKQIPIKNRRRYFRLRLDFPLCAEMTVLKFKNKELKLGMSKALIQDISLGGLRYLSNVDLPVQEDFVLLFTTEIFDKKRQFVGYNVWKSEVNGFYEYGFKFTINNKQRDQFAAVFNQLTLQLKSSPFLANCSFLKGNMAKYLQS